MSAIRRVAAICLVAASISLAIATGGFTAVTADRPVEVAVVQDENAYLGIADEVQCGVGTGQGDNKWVIKNRFATSLDTVTIEVSVPVGSPGALRVSDAPGAPFERLESGDSTQFRYSLGPGEEAMLQVQPPSGNTTAADSLDVEVVKAEGDGVGMSASARTVDVDCPAGNPGSNSKGTNNPSSDNSGNNNPGSNNSGNNNGNNSNN